MEDNIQRMRAGVRVTILSLVANTVLFAAKLWVGIASRSLAMVADALHTLSDSLTSVIVMIGIKVSHKPADEKHPFGHGRSDLIASLIVSIFLGVAGVDFIKRSIENFFTQESPQFSLSAIVVFVFSLAIKEFLARYSIGVGRKTGSQALIADGWHHRSDAYTTVIVLISILLGKFIWWADSVAAILVAGFLLHAAYEILVNTSSRILGEDIDEEFAVAVKEIVRSVSAEVSDVHHLHLHDYGDHKELTFHVRMPKNKRIEDAHATTTDIKNEMREKMGVEATIYLDPE